jgi:hypothetical protein
MNNFNRTLVSVSEFEELVRTGLQGIMYDPYLLTDSRKPIYINYGVSEDIRYAVLDGSVIITNVKFNFNSAFDAYVYIIDMLSHVDTKVPLSPELLGYYKELQFHAHVYGVTWEMPTEPQKSHLQKIVIEIARRMGEIEGKGLQMIESVLDTVAIVKESIPSNVYTLAIPAVVYGLGLPATLTALGGLMMGGLSTLTTKQKILLIAGGASIALMPGVSPAAMAVLNSLSSVSSASTTLSQVYYGIPTAFSALSSIIPAIIPAAAPPAPAIGAGMLAMAAKIGSAMLGAFTVTTVAQKILMKEDDEAQPFVVEEEFKEPVENPEDVKKREAEHRARLADEITQSILKDLHDEIQTKLAAIKLKKDLEDEENARIMREVEREQAAHKQAEEDREIEKRRIYYQKADEMKRITMEMLQSAISQVDKKNAVRKIARMDKQLETEHIVHYIHAWRKHNNFKKGLDKLKPLNIKSHFEKLYENAKRKFPEGSEIIEEKPATFSPISNINFDMVVDLPPIIRKTINTIVKQADVEMEKLEKEVPGYALLTKYAMDAGLEDDEGDPVSLAESQNESIRSMKLLGYANLCLKVLENNPQYAEELKLLKHELFTKITELQTIWPTEVMLLREFNPYPFKQTFSHLFNATTTEARLEMINRIDSLLTPFTNEARVAIGACLEEEFAALLSVMSESGMSIFFSGKTARDGYELAKDYYKFMSELSSNEIQACINHPMVINERKQLKICAILNRIVSDKYPDIVQIAYDITLDENFFTSYQRAHRALKQVPLILRGIPPIPTAILIMQAKSKEYHKQESQYTELIATEIKTTAEPAILRVDGVFNVQATPSTINHYILQIGVLTEKITVLYSMIHDYPTNSNWVRYAHIEAEIHSIRLPQSTIIPIQLIRTNLERMKTVDKKIDGLMADIEQEKLIELPPIDETEFPEDALQIVQNARRSLVAHASELLSKRDEELVNKANVEREALERNNEIGLAAVSAQINKLQELQPEEILNPATEFDMIQQIFDTVGVTSMKNTKYFISNFTKMMNTFIKKSTISESNKPNAVELYNSISRGELTDPKAIGIHYFIEKKGKATTDEVAAFKIARDVAYMTIDASTNKHSTEGIRAFEGFSQYGQIGHSLIIQTNLLHMLIGTSTSSLPLLGPDEAIVFASDIGITDLDTNWLIIPLQFPVIMCSMGFIYSTTKSAASSFYRGTPILTTPKIMLDYEGINLKRTLQKVRPNIRHAELARIHTPLIATVDAARQMVQASRTIAQDIISAESAETTALKRAVPYVDAIRRQLTPDPRYRMFDKLLTEFNTEMMYLSKFNLTFYIKAENFQQEDIVEYLSGGKFITEKMEAITRAYDDVSTKLRLVKHTPKEDYLNEIISDFSKEDQIRSELIVLEMSRPISEIIGALLQIKLYRSGKYPNIRIIDHETRHTTYSLGYAAIYMKKYLASKTLQIDEFLEMHPSFRTEYRLISLFPEDGFIIPQDSNFDKIILKVLSKLLAIAEIEMYILVNVLANWRFDIFVHIDVSKLEGTLEELELHNIQLYQTARKNAKPNALKKLFDFVRAVYTSESDGLFGIIFMLMLRFESSTISPLCFGKTNRRYRYNYFDKAIIKLMNASSRHELLTFIETDVLRQESKPEREFTDCAYIKGSRDAGNLRTMKNPFFAQAFDSWVFNYEDQIAQQVPYADTPERTIRKF